MIKSKKEEFGVKTDADAERLVKESKRIGAKGMVMSAAGSTATAIGTSYSFMVKGLQRAAEAAGMAKEKAMEYAKSTATHVLGAVKTMKGKGTANLVEGAAYAWDGTKHVLSEGGGWIWNGSKFVLRTTATWVINKTADKVVEHTFYHVVGMAVTKGLGVALTAAVGGGTVYLARRGRGDDLALPAP